MWTISFIKQGLMKTEYLQHREIMVKYNAREDVIQIHMMRKNQFYSLIRLNMDEAVVPESFGKRAIGIGGSMAKAITDIRGQVL